MTESTIQIKVYVQKDDRALLVCPACGHTHELDAAKFRDQTHALTGRCRCQNILSVSLEFRNQARKEVQLTGSFTMLSPDKGAGGSILIYNLSRTGIGFSVISGPEPQVGQKLRLEFQLDDRKGSRISKDAVVRSVHGEMIGCAFHDQGELAGALGFYLQG